MKQSKIIVIHQKDTISHDFACGNCFAGIDEPNKEEYCWSCGVDLSNDDWAYNLENLLKKEYIG